MKGLRKYLTPFAPDQSGAVSVLYPLGGLIVIIDAGGCTGNICGFDEPRWLTMRSAIFSAGLRDMDAILGRDHLMIEKIMKIIDDFDLHFIALIGTPVPSVIGTDYRGLKRILEKKTNLPVLSIDTNGMELYDKGVEKAYQALVRLPQCSPTQKTNKVGLLGFTPLDYTEANLAYLKAHYQKEGYDEVVVFGETDYEPFTDLSSFQEIIVMSPAGIKAARTIKRHYQVDYQMLDVKLIDIPEGEKTLIIHQQVIANALRKPGMIVGSYFTLNKSHSQEGDVAFRDEDDLTDYIRSHEIKRVVADASFAPLIGEAELIPLHHRAVSGDECYG